MITIVLDPEEIQNLTDFFALIRSRLEMPEYFRDNLDSLFDCLSEQKEDICFLIRDRDSLIERLGSLRGKALMRLLYCAADSNPHITVTEE